MTTIHGDKEARQGVASPYLPWPVANSYRVEDGAIVESQDERGRYRPLEHPDVLFEFAKIDGSSHSVLEYVRRWGLLGRLDVYVGTSGGFWWDEKNEPERRATSGPETVAWITAHVTGVRKLLKLTELFLDAKDNGKTDALARWLGNQHEAGAVMGMQAGSWAGSFANPAAPGYEKPSPMVWAYAILSSRVTNELGSVRYGLHPRVDLYGPPGDLALGPVLRAPLEAIYHHLGRLVVGELRFDRCKAPDCRHYFRVADGRMGYCPFPVAPLSRRRGRSRCATRHRLQRRRGNVKNAPLVE